MRVRGKGGHHIVEVGAPASGGEVVEMCLNVGCPRVKDFDGTMRCTVYISPAYWWWRGRCPIPNIPKELEKEFKLNPLKQSRRKMSGGLILGYRLNKAGYDGKHSKV